MDQNAEKPNIVVDTLQFVVGDILGSGAQGQIVSVTDKNSGKVYALKKIRMENGMVPHHAIREASILLEVLLKQILSAVSHCYSLGILHRDLKPENILVDTKDIFGGHIIKLADFGLSRALIPPNASLTPEVVTLNYRAPELLMGSQHYRSAVDIWSAGCVFAEMLTGEVLFDGSSEILVLNKIFSKLGIPSEDSWPGVSSIPGFQAFKGGGGTDSMQGLGAEFECLKPVELDLLRKLVALDPASRISATEALKHAYFST